MQSNFASEEANEGRDDNESIVKSFDKNMKTQMLPNTVKTNKMPN